MPVTSKRRRGGRNVEKAGGAPPARRTATGGKRVAGVKGVLFVQGAGAGTHDSWDNKLVASLEEALGPGYSVHFPRMPDEDNPDPGVWKSAISRELRELGDGAILVGHSLGAAIILDLLADRDGDGHGRRLAGVFLVATPFIGKGGWPLDDLRPTTKVAATFPDETPLYLYQGSEDDTVPAGHVELFAKVLPQAAIRRLEGRNHQLNDDLSELAQDIRLLK
jgi:predicted alpha/beta hydrolase family esterase